MRRLFLLPLTLALLMLSMTVRADQDDIDNNADLQPTPEERARAAVLKRWPDATEVDAADMAGDEADPDDDDAEVNKKDGVVERADDMAADDHEKDDENDAEPTADWTVSVMFKSGGKDFEALVNDDGKIQYVYETIPNDKAPETVIAAAREAVKDTVKDGELIYVQKMTDESKALPVQSYIVGIGPKDIQLDADGKVLSIKDAPAEKNNEDDEAPDDDMKMRI